MKKRNILDLFAALKNVSGLKGVKFAYAIVKNRETLRPEVEALQSAQEEKENYKAYTAEQMKLGLIHCDKDDKGQPIIDKMTGTIYFTQNGEEWKKVLAELNETHKEAIEERKKQMEDYESILDEEVEIPLIKIKEEHLPSDITAAQLEKIFVMVE